MDRLTRAVSSLKMALLCSSLWWETVEQWRSGDMDHGPMPDSIYDQRSAKSRLRLNIHRHSLYMSVNTHRWIRVRMKDSFTFDRGRETQIHLVLAASQIPSEDGRENRTELQMHWTELWELNSEGLREQLQGAHLNMWTPRDQQQWSERLGWSCVLLPSLHWGINCIDEIF